MQELDEALSDIVLIRQHLARSAEFRGYGSLAVAATGVLALLVATAQSIWMSNIPKDTHLYVAWWMLTAAASFAGTVVEAACRCRRLHGTLAWAMLQSALEQFLPAVAAGGLLTIVLLRAAPANAWMLPGLWQVFFSLGVFASWRSLPRPIFAVGVWYLGCGLLCLAFIPSDRALSPWVMGVPFGIGQIMVGAVLHAREREPQIP